MPLTSAPIHPTPERRSRVPSQFRSESPSSCALLFFGLPKSFRDLVLPSIRRYVTSVNPTCDVYLHTYNVSTVSSARNGEIDAPLNVSDVRLLTEDVAITTVEEFTESVNVTRYHPYNPVSFGWGTGECCPSMDNMLKQWHSIRRVWELMERGELIRRQQQQQRQREDGRTHYYERVGLFRSDVVYTHPISILSPDEHAMVPDFLIYDGLPWMNDRMFYGLRSHASVWATERFGYVDEYLRKNWVGRKVGLHSETFLRQLMEMRGVPYSEKAICFWRARANGAVLTTDCDVPCRVGNGGGALWTARACKWRRWANNRNISKPFVWALFTMILFGFHRWWRRKQRGVLSSWSVREKRS